MNDYSLWAPVVFNSLLFIAVAASFFHATRIRDRRALGGVSAFIIDENRRSHAHRRIDAVGLIFGLSRSSTYIHPPLNAFVERPDPTTAVADHR